MQINAFLNLLDYTPPDLKFTELKSFNAFDENLSTKSTSVIVQDLI